MYNFRRFYRLRELHETDFDKPGIYGSGRVWDNAWDVFRRAPSRVGRGRRAAVDFVVCFGWGVFFRVFCSFFSFERTRPAASTRRPCLMYLPPSIESRPRERRDRGRFLPFGQKSVFVMRPFFAYRQKSLFIPGCVQGAII